MRLAQAGFLASALLALSCTDRTPTDPAPVQTTISTEEPVATVIGQTVVFFAPRWENSFSQVECTALGTSIDFLRVQQAVVVTAGSLPATPARVLTDIVFPPGQPFVVLQTFTCDGFQLLDVSPGIIIALEVTALGP